MKKQMKEIWLDDDDNYRILLLMSGFVISIFYDKELINPGQTFLLKKKQNKENDKIMEVMCRCVSHNHDRLVLV